jgi:hypothetical protein
MGGLQTGTGRAGLNTRTPDKGIPSCALVGTLFTLDEMS